MARKRLFICEKPSQAEKVAKVLGNARKTPTYWETDGGLVAAASGHMLRSLTPDEMDPERWGSPWRWDQLPMLPDELRYVPEESRKGQVIEIGRLLRECSEVVIATDGGDEGEMIGRELLDHHRYKGPVQRLWITSQTPGDIQKALNKILPGEKTIRYYYAAKARAEADWLIGMNGSRALTNKSPRAAGPVSIGRVQTPTVAMIVRRDREIAAFRVQDYYDLAALVHTESGAEVILEYRPDEHILDRAKAAGIAKAAQDTTNPLSVTHEKGKKRYAPPPFDLTSLQREANRIWKWTAKRTLATAQSLYERHDAITYPRVDCRYFSDDAAAEVPALMAKLLKLEPFVGLKGETFKAGEYFNSKKVEGHDHDALRPTDEVPDLNRLDDDECKLYLLIARQFMACLMPPYIYDAVAVRMNAGGVEFSATGNTPVSQGWKVALKESDDEEGKKSKEKAEQKLPPLKDGEPGKVSKCELLSKKTKPPRHYTEGDLLGDMENVAKFVTDKSLAKILNSENEKRKGIGAPSSRDSVIEDLKRRSYITVEGKNAELIATQKAHAVVTLIERSVPALADPGETALWQIEIDKIKDGMDPKEFTGAIKKRIGEYIATLAHVDTKILAAAMGMTEKGTGVRIPAYPDAQDQAEPELVDRGDHYTAEGWPGRFFKEIANVALTPTALAELIRAGAAGVQREVPSKFKGKPAQRVKITFDGAAKPYPKINIEWPKAVGTTAAGAATGVRAQWGKTEAEILDWGTFYTVPGVQVADKDVKFFKAMASHQITAAQLADILGGGKEGVKMSGKLFRGGAGNAFPNDPGVFFNPRKKPFPGLEFSFAAAPLPEPRSGKTPDKSR